MAVMDEFKEVRKAALQNSSFKEKLSYFWCYYKWRVIVPIIIVACVTSFIYQVVTRKDTILYCAFVNGFIVADDQGTSFANGFAEANGFDVQTQEAILDTSMSINLKNFTDENTYNTVQKMMVLLAAGEIDTVTTGSTIFQYLSYVGHFTDLREVFSPQQLEALESKLYYIDGKILEEKAATEEQLQDYVLPEVDPKNPSSMTQPIPVGIILDETTEEFRNSIAFTEKEIVIGISCTSKRPETSVAFMEYIMGETIE